MRIIHSRLNQKIFAVWNWLLDFFFPVYCVGCQTEGDFLCSTCRQKLPPPGGDNLPEWITAGFDYGDETVRELVWRLKYQKQTAVAKEMAEMLSAKIESQTVDQQGPIWLAPVPLFWWRHLRRGYNQAEILARELVKINPEKFLVKKNLVKKIKNTDPQAKVKKRSDRLQNLTSAFVVDKSAGPLPAHQPIILIDDVSTTGATLSEIRRLLIRAGAKNIRALVFAHG